MAELRYPTDASFSGPWLISIEQLDKLDEILAPEMAALRISAEKRRSEYVDQRIANYYSQLSEERKELKRTELLTEEKNKYAVQKEIQVSLIDGKKPSGSTFKEISSHPEVSNARIVNAALSVQTDSTRASMIIGGSYDNELRVSVTGDDQKESQALFIALRDWASDVQAPPWQRVWSRFAPFHCLILITVVVFSISFFLADLNNSEYLDEAHDLVVKGIGSKDITEALEIILALQSDYQPKRRSAPALFYLLLLAGLLLCIALSFRPRVEIGIGRGKLRLKRWNRWTYFVGIATPTYLLTAVGSPMLLKFIEHLL